MYKKTEKKYGKIKAPRTLGKKAQEEAVSPVIAVILMVAITVVLAAVLFVMVQEIVPPGGSGPLAMSGSVDNIQNGWLVKIAAGVQDNNSDVSYYLLDPDTGSRENGTTITWNDVDLSNSINSGDTFFIEDPTHIYSDYGFTISNGDSTVEFKL